MKHRTRILILPALAGLAAAGPIDPPAGPVQSTMKTLDQVEPRTAIGAAGTPGDNDATPSTFKITQPGSYYLTGDVTGEAGRIGIEIAADGVTIDLGGFTLEGVQGSLVGIQATTGGEGVTVRNGAVRSWGQSGIYLSSTVGCRIEAVTALRNGGPGIVAGSEAVVTGCVARNNSYAGLAAGAGSTVSNCTAAYNGSAGIAVSESAVVSACVARHNTGVGFECNGIATLSGCSSTYNSSAGFIAGYGATYTACTAAYNEGDGFWVNISSTASGCSAYQNGRDGFHVWHGSVLASRADENGRDGIRLDTGLSTASDNTCRGNGVSEPGAGIRAVQTGSRVDSNQVIANDYGIVATTDCVIVRNTARANASGNYSFPSGSEYAQIITNPGNGFTSTNPWANFAY